MPAIPFATRRAAERRRLEALIDATPSAARFRTWAGNVLMGGLAKAREMMLGGYGAGYAGQALIALPLGSKPPEPAKEWIEITDHSGATVRYDIVSCTPSIGQECYDLGLKARNTKPTRSAVPGQR